MLLVGRGDTGTQTHRGEGHVKPEAEMGVSDAAAGQGSPGTVRTRRGRKDPSHETLEGEEPTSRFQTLGSETLWEINFFPSEPPSLWSLLRQPWGTKRAPSKY